MWGEGSRWRVWVTVLNDLVNRLLSVYFVHHSLIKKYAKEKNN